MISMIDLVTISMKTLRIDSVWSLEKEFTELILMNPWMVLYVIVNQIDSCRYCIGSPLTWDIKDIL